MPAGPWLLLIEESWSAELHDPHIPLEEEEEEGEEDISFKIYKISNKYLVSASWVRDHSDCDDNKGKYFLLD